MYGFKSLFNNDIIQNAEVKENPRNTIFESSVFGLNIKVVIAAIIAVISNAFINESLLISITIPWKHVSKSY